MQCDDTTEGVCTEPSRARHKCENHYRRMMHRDRGCVRLLPEDGIIDELAIEIAASGVRRVRLTHRERRLAIARILSRFDGTDDLVYERLGVRANDLRYR